MLLSVYTRQQLWTERVLFQLKIMICWNVCTETAREEGKRVGVGKGRDGGGGQEEKEE